MINNDSKGNIGISGSTIKIIAIVTMFIDHVGATYGKNMYGLNPDSDFWKIFYYTLRVIGRISFPLFCFLLVEGFIHTSNVRKYGLRLLALAFISEVPFDLCIYGKVFYVGHSNVMFTLFIGLCVMYFITKYGSNRNSLTITVASILAGMGLAYLIGCDYGDWGIMVIMAMFLLRDKIMQRDILCSVLMILTGRLEIASLASLVPIHLYNGERGIRMKLPFYLFYPVHLLVLWFIFVYL